MRAIRRAIEDGENHRMQPSVLAIAAHPDDIEFVMAGTLLRLAQAGWQVHYFNIANGCCGSQQLNREECAAVRLQEAARAAAAIPAEFYPPICNDLEIFYDHATHARVTSIVRRVRPSMILTHALSDYMEDHQNAARLAVALRNHQDPGPPRRAGRTDAGGVRHRGRNCAGSRTAARGARRGDDRPVRQRRQSRRPRDDDGSGNPA